VRVQPNPASASKPLWRVFNNVAPGAKPVVEAKGNVIFGPTQVSPVPWNMP